MRHVVAIMIFAWLVPYIAAQDEIIFRNGRAYRVSGGKPLDAATVEPISESPPAKTTIIKRSSAPWIDPDIGPWTESKLRRHLLGELASPQHRGDVPANELKGRSLAELKAIHANLHEGWNWDGSPKVSPSRDTVFEEIDPGFGECFSPMPGSQCPGGRCPPQSRPLFRRFR